MCSLVVQVRAGQTHFRMIFRLYHACLLGLQLTSQLAIVLGKACMVLSFCTQISKSQCSNVDLNSVFRWNCLQTFPFPILYVRYFNPVGSFK